MIILYLGIPEILTFFANCTMVLHLLISHAIFFETFFLTAVRYVHPIRIANFPFLALAFVYMEYIHVTY